MTSPTPRPMDAVEALLYPIAADAPGGEPLRYTATYDSIQEARSSDAGLPQGAWQRAEKRADWREVERLCTEALQKRSKDLQIAVWLCKAWLQTRHLPGFLTGVDLLTGLHQRFLLTMYPVREPGAPLSADTVEHRANLIQAFNERMALALKFVPLCAPDRAELGFHHLADIEKIQYDAMVRRRMNQDAPSENPLTVVEKRMTATPSAWFVATDHQLAEAEAATRAFDSVLDTCYGEQNAGLGEIVKTLAAMRAHILPRLPEPLPEPPPEPEEIDAVEQVSSLIDEVKQASGILTRVRQLFSGDSSQSSPDVVYDSGQPQSVIQKDSEEVPPSLVRPSQIPTGPDLSGRREAYDRLREIAEYLERTEPHSPVPALLRRAIRWGSMDFQDLLQEMVNSPQGIAGVQELLRPARDQ